LNGLITTVTSFIRPLRIKHNCTMYTQWLKQRVCQKCKMPVIALAVQVQPGAILPG